MSAGAIVSLIVPSWTGRIAGLREQLARQSCRRWTLIVRERVAPAGRARNLGARRAVTPWLIFLDDDVRFSDRDVLDRMLAQLLRLDPRSAIGLLCAPAPGGNRFQRWYAAESFAPALPPDNGQPLAEVDWHTVGTAGFGLARETFERLGGFDEQLRSGEDYELGYRLCRQGGRIYVLRGAALFHAPPADFAQAVRKTVWYEQGNAQLARRFPSSGYRLALRSRAHAAAYLLARTLALIPLIFIKVSYHHRRPRVAFRPLAALLSYIGAWVYCWAWFAGAEAPEADAPASEPLAVGHLDDAVAQAERRADGLA